MAKSPQTGMKAASISLTVWNAICYFSTMKKSCFFSFLFLFLLFGSSHAFDVSGLQPLAPDGLFSTFSTESLPKNKFSVELVLERSRQVDFYRTTMKGAYGISNNLEFIASVPYVHHFENSIDGFEDIAIGFKHRFYDEGKFGPSLAYLLTASIPVGHDDLSTDGRVGVGIILSKRIGPFQGSFNLLYFRPGKGYLEDEISFNSGIVFSATHNSEILAEFQAKKSHFSSEYDQLEARLGYRLKTADSLFTTIGAGVDLKNRNPEYRLLLMITFTNARDKKKIKKIIEEEE
jgi:hypothetical protein